MTLSDQQWEFEKDLAKLVIFAEANGYKLTGGEKKRYPERQQALLDAGKTKTLNSDHLYSLAQDYNIFYDYDNDGDQDFIGTMSKQDALKASEKLCEYWKSLNPLNYSGRDWGWDIPHFGRKRA